MTRTIHQAILLAGLVLLAGCTGGLSGVADSPTAGSGQTGTTAATATAASQTSTSSTSTSDLGTVAFYISDEENAIGDFQQLEVTITKVGFERVSSGNGGWVEFAVDNETVDLTEVQGDNATLIDEFDLPNGTYTKVFVHVGTVNGTLQDGTQVNVKLPSERLQIQKQFSVDNGSSVDFVFDITVHKAGQSGKYILTPVISESGTDVPINDVDDEEEKEEERGDDREAESALNATFVTNVTQGENTTLRVTRNGSAVENATVTVNDEVVGATNASGELTFGVPEEDTLTVLVEAGDDEVELEREFESDAES